MKAILSVPLMMSFVTFAGGCLRTSDVMVVRDPCGTFVSEHAPRKTPRLHGGVGEGLLLEVSFTPAKNEEAFAIIESVKNHPTRLKIEKTGRVLVADRLGNGSVLVVVASREEAQTVLQELCFTDGRLFGPEEDD